MKHPNIVQVFDFDTLADGTPYMVMELLTGKTLHEAFVDRRKAIPATLAYEITRQLCEALERVHSHAPPVVHRDIKPQNLFLHRPEYGDPAVKVLDFGIAAMMDQSNDGTFFGTLRYASPEQFRGEAPTPRADIYSAALVLYEMLAGRGPFDDQRDITIAHLRTTPPRLRQFAPWVPETVDQLVAQSLSKDPDKRPRSAYALISKLFELQWVRDGVRAPSDVNTTAPTLTAIIDAEGEAPASAPGSTGRCDTFRGMTPPPVDGRTPECAPPELSAETIERMSGARQVVQVSPSAEGSAPTAPTTATLEPLARGAGNTPVMASLANSSVRAQTNERAPTYAIANDAHARANAQAAAPPAITPLATEPPAIAALSTPVASESGTAHSVAGESLVIPRRRHAIIYFAIACLLVFIGVGAAVVVKLSERTAPAAAATASPSSAVSTIEPLVSAPTASSATMPAASVPAPVASVAPSASASSLARSATPPRAFPAVTIATSTAPIPADFKRDFTPPPTPPSNLQPERTP